MTQEGTAMPTIEESIDVDVPVRTAYDQWTQFETFPQFMSGVDDVRQVDDTHSHWTTTIAGATREFDTEITEQHPDERVAWKATDGTKNAGVVTFHQLDNKKTRVMVQIDWEPDTLTAKAGAVVGADDHQVKVDLKRFKKFIEERGNETGAYRGDVPRT
jgi:uncharacterized membrane protein